MAESGRSIARNPSDEADRERVTVTACCCKCSNSIRRPPAHELFAVDAAVSVEVDLAKADLHLLLGHACLETVQELLELIEIHEPVAVPVDDDRSEEHTSELLSRENL